LLVGEHMQMQTLPGVGEKVASFDWLSMRTRVHIQRPLAARRILQGDVKCFRAFCELLYTS